jgi:hypothetical protein
VGCGSLWCSALSGLLLLISPYKQYWCAGLLCRPGGAAVLPLFCFCQAAGAHAYLGTSTPPASSLVPPLLLGASRSPNLLASGGADGELCIWDVGNPLQPSLYPAMKGGSGGPQPEITHLTWNRKVQHILATCTAAGTVVVWDLKKQRPVISFKDPSG